MVKEDEEIEVIDTEEKFTKFFKDIRRNFDEIEEKRHSSNEDDLSRVAELVIENFGHACSLEEMDNLSELIIDLANPENPKKIRITIAKKLDFKFFNQTPQGYKTYEELLLELNNDPDEEIRKLILNKSNEDIEKHLSEVKSDPEHQKALKRYYAIFDPNAFKPILDFNKMIQEQVIATQSALNSVRVAQEQIRSLTSTLDYYKGINERIEAFSNLMSPSFRFIEILKGIGEITPFWEEDEYKIFEYNWLSFCSARVILRIYKEYKNGNEEEIKKFFFKMFNNKDNIEKLKDKFKTNEIFLDRLHIINDALDAHLDGKYTLSIPILLSQIDGIIIKEFGYILKGKNKGNCSECGKPISPVPNAKNIALELLNELNDINSSYYLEFIKKDYNKNRIPILHGLEINYSDPNYSTKLILALYRLFHFLNEGIRRNT